METLLGGGVTSSCDCGTKDMRAVLLVLVVDAEGDAGSDGVRGGRLETQDGVSCSWC